MTNVISLNDLCVHICRHLISFLKFCIKLLTESKFDVIATWDECLHHQGHIKKILFLMS